MRLVIQGHVTANVQVIGQLARIYQQPHYKCVGRHTTINVSTGALPVSRSYGCIV